MEIWAKYCILATMVSFYQGLPTTTKESPTTPKYAKDTIGICNRGTFAIWCGYWELFVGYPWIIYGSHFG